MGANLQTIPPEARHCFVAEEGHLLMSRDYDNLEVRVLAYETGDKALIDMLESGKNIHDENVRVLFGLKKTDKLWKAARAAAKVVQFGKIQYLGGDREIYERLSLKAPELRLTFAAFKKAVDAWFAAHPVVKRWQAAIKQHILEHRKVTDAFGRIRVLMGDERDIIKEGTNFMIQAPAAHIKNHSLIQLQDVIEAKHLKAKIILDIHDELVLEVPRAEVPTLKALTKKIMERTVDYRSRKVTFPTSYAVGSDWGKLK